MDAETTIDAGRQFSTLHCPDCGHQSREAMPVDACAYFYACPGCDRLLKPHPGDCCVFCSYGDRPCTPPATDAPLEERTLWMMATRGGLAELRLRREPARGWSVVLSMNGRRVLTHGCGSETAGVELGTEIKRRWPSPREER